MYWDKYIEEYKDIACFIRLCIDVDRGVLYLSLNFRKEYGCYPKYSVDEHNKNFKHTPKVELKVSDFKVIDKNAEFTKDCVYLFLHKNAYDGYHMNLNIIGFNNDSEDNIIGYIKIFDKNDVRVSLMKHAIGV